MKYQPLIKIKSILLALLVFAGLLFLVACKEPNPVSIVAKTNSSRIEVVEGNDLDLGVFTFFAVYKNGDEKEIEKDEVVLSGFDSKLDFLNSEAIKQTLTFTYKRLTTKVDIFIVPKEIRSIILLTSDTDGRYLINDELDLTKYSMLISFASGETKEIELSEKYIDNYEDLPIQDGKLITAGNFEIIASYRGIRASNAARIIVSKHNYLEEVFEVLKSESLVDPLGTYIEIIPNVSRVELSEITNGKYKVLKSVDGVYDEEEFELAEWQSSNVFLNLEVNQEYTFFGRQDENELYSQGQIYSVVHKTKPILSPTPVVLSFGYDYIEIIKEKFVQYQLNKYSKVEVFENSVKFSNLEPNAEYVITSKYQFVAASNQILTSQISQKVSTIDNPFKPFTFQEQTFNNQEIHYEISLQDEFANFGNIITEITYNDSLTVPVDAGVYQVKIKHRFSPNVLLAGNLRINKLNISLKVLDSQKRYLEDDPVFDYEVTSYLPDNFNQNEIIKTFSRINDERVGTYQVGLVASHKNLNFQITPGILTIKKQIIYAQVGDLTKEFGSNLQAPSYEFINSEPQFLSGDDPTFIPKYTYQTANINTNLYLNSGTYFNEINLVLTNSSYEVIVINKGSITVTPYPITVTMNQIEKTYGEIDPHLTYSLSNIGHRDRLGVVLQREAGNSVGTYQISLQSYNSLNFIVTVVPATFIINPANITFQVNDYEVVYGSNYQSFASLKVTSGSLIGNDKLSNFMIEYDELLDTNVGTHQLGATISNPNYQITVLKGNLTIKPKELKIIPVANQMKVYGEADPSLLFSTTGLIDDDEVSINISRMNGEDVGNYSYHLTESPANNNYFYTLVPETFTIVKRQSLVLINNPSKVYGESDPDFTYQFTNLLLAEDVNQLTGSVSRVLGEDVGNYRLNLGTLKLANYQLTLETTIFTINKKMITINYNLSSEYTYGDLVDLTNASANLLVNQYIQLVGYQINSGIHQITPIIKNNQGQNVTSNFEITNPSFALTIKKAVLTITPQNITKVYANNDPIIRYTITVGLKYSDRPQVLSGNIIRTSGEDVGSYPLITSNLVATNYDVALTNQYFTITPKPITVVFEKDYTYNQAVQQLIISNDQASFISVSTTPSIFKNAGNYQVGFTSTNPNYTVVNSSEVVTIEKHDVEITVDNKARKIGESNPIFTADLSVLADLDEMFNHELLVFDTAANTSSNYGNYPITITSGFVSNNYNFIYIDGWLMISPPNFNVQYQLVSEYNSLTQPLVVTITNDDNEDVTSAYTITLSYSGNQTPLNAGSYPVTITINDGVSNTIFNETQIINKRNIEIDYHINEPMIYGDSFSYNQGTANNLLSGDRIEFFGDMSGIGPKSLYSRIYDSANHEVTNNYNISNQTYNFEIIKAELVIIPLTLTKPYGNPDGALTFRAEGFKKGETTSIISGNLSRLAGEEVGTYPFDISNLVTSFYNLTLSSQYQDFEITKRVVNLTYNFANSFVYGDQIVASLSGDNLLNNHTLTTSSLPTNVGSYVVEAIVIDENLIDVTHNYLLSHPTYQITIAPKTLTISPNKHEKVYGDDDTIITYLVSGYVNDESNLILGNLSRQEGEEAGIYNVQIGTLQVNSINYSLLLNEQTFEIKKKNLAFTFQEQQYIYSGQIQNINLLTNDLISGDEAIITNNNFIQVGTYNLNISVKKGLVDVTSSYEIDLTTLVLTISPKMINSVNWIYSDNQIAQATSSDLALNEEFILNNHNNLTPGVHIATILENSNYTFSNATLQAFEYTHIGTIDFEIEEQFTIFNGLPQKYDISTITNLGYQVIELDNNNQTDVNRYPVSLRLSKEFYFDKDYSTYFSITPKEVMVQYGYQNEYLYNDTNYLDNNLITLSEPLSAYEYTVKNYQIVNNELVLVTEFIEIGIYRIMYEISNQNYKTSTINYFEIEIIPAELTVIVNDQLLIDGELAVYSHSTTFTESLVVTYSAVDEGPVNNSIDGLITGRKLVSVTKVQYQNQDITNKFNLISTSYEYTIISKDYILLADYNKDDLDRSGANVFANGYLEATKNPQIGFGYRYHNKYYSNRFIGDVLNSSFATFNSNYHYKFGNNNRAVIYLGGLINLDSLEYDNIRVDGLGVSLIGFELVDLTSNEIHNSARTTRIGLALSFAQLGEQIITISYEKYGKKIQLAKLSIEVMDGFTNITKYEDLFNSNNQTIQNVILNNGIAYLQTKGVTITVSAGSTLYGNNYEINSYSAAYLDTAKPYPTGRNLIHTSGVLDNVRVIQRRVTSYESTSNDKGLVNSDTAVSFNGGIIRNSFIAYGRETVEITSTTADLVIENSTILGGPFGIRRRSIGKLTLTDVKVIQRPDLDLGGMGVPIVYLNNEGTSIKTLDVNNITLEVLGSTKIYSFETLENLKKATLPFGVKEVVGDIMDDLWNEFSDQLIYTRNGQDVMAPAVLFVSLEAIKDQLDIRNPVVNFATNYQYAYKNITIAQAYGYVYTYNHIESSGIFTQEYIENEGLLNPPPYHSFMGEYEGD